MAGPRSVGKAGEPVSSKVGCVDQEPGLGGLQVLSDRQFVRLSRAGLDSGFRNRR